MKEAGRDATAAFEPFHPKDIADKLLSPSLRMGMLDTTSTPVATTLQVDEPSEKKTVGASSKPPLSAMFNIFDFEVGLSVCWMAVVTRWPAMTSTFE